MREKRILAALCVSVLTLGLLAFGREGQSAPPTQEGPATQEESPELPDQVAYLHLFRQIAAFKKRAEKLEREGKDSAALKTYFKRKAGLDDPDARVLDHIADQCERELQLQDAKAKAVIDAFKAQYPGGRVPHGELPKPPPAELRAMSEERDAIVLRYRDLLRASLGEEGFGRVQTFAKRRIVPDTFPQPTDQAPLAAQPTAQ